MRPLFTIHAGEFIVGELIERSFPELNVWIPSKDTGIDLLVTDKNNSCRPISLQVKLSRDYKAAEALNDLDRRLVALGWLTLNHDKIKKSPADYWVFVLVSHERKRQPYFIVIQPQELLRRLVAIHGEAERYHFYPWVMDSGLVLDGRGLSVKDKKTLAADGVVDGERDLSQYLGNWECLKNLGMISCL